MWATWGLLTLQVAVLAVHLRLLWLQNKLNAQARRKWTEAGDHLDRCKTIALEALAYRNMMAALKKSMEKE